MVFFVVIVVFFSQNKTLNNSPYLNLLRYKKLKQRSLVQENSRWKIYGYKKDINNIINKDMKLVLILSQMVILAAIVTACGTMNNKQKDADDIRYTVADHYFFNNNASIPENPVVTTQEVFDSLYGAAAVMGKNGEPTAIDFDKQFVIGVVLPLTNDYTEITPVRLSRHDSILTLSYRVSIGERNLSWTMRPMTLIIVDRKYLSPSCVLKRLDPSAK